ncbi:MAG: Two-component response regulator, GGDEF domain protein [Parcubacteria group bacterium GW2011_GWA2_47_8]|nr:MAG: Two-component response regulator, GGDEF domain protein [Parcubacteria group bacterium GW2011_GWA2_47_8]OHB19255.1 MAG: hypothetical protein A2666_00145 [Parcubacteria group bacterium RIFCSPHIGHO2_01_FULL_47_10b]
MADEKLVVLVEDDDFISEMYATKFQVEGYAFEVAHNGEEGLRLIKEKKPVLVLCDIILPKMDGFEVLETLKKDPETKMIPVLLLTNLGQKKNIKQGLKLGAADYIIKAHYTPKEVVEKAKAILNAQNNV